MFHQNAEETKKKNEAIIEGLKKENDELKGLRDQLLANKKVFSELIFFQISYKEWSSWLLQDIHNQFPLHGFGR